jgi:hypothetical protein
MPSLSPHEFQERERIACERDEAAEQFSRFAPVKRDWWQARQEDGLPTLAEEMAARERIGVEKLVISSAS